ncbi:MAG: hypothetical protein Q8Q04_01470 [archaeon]|nr:hypothetical protein [archaeon]
MVSEIKKEEKKVKKRKEKEEISEDWFEDHESYSEEGDEKEENEGEVSEEELEELEEKLEEDEEFHSRVRHFLANQKKDVSLENMLEVPESNLEENFPKKKEEEKIKEDTLDYLTGNQIEGMKYQAFEPDTRLSRPDMSSSERILAEQKALYSHLKSSGGHMIGENRNEWDPVTPEDTHKRKYLKGKKFTTGPY